jgi:hypothetical protein
MYCNANLMAGHWERDWHGNYVDSVNSEMRRLSVRNLRQLCVVPIDRSALEIASS